MKLTFAKQHISIRQFSPITLPSFTILTGLNGAGKTHFLQAIDSGAITVEGVPQHLIKYYNLANFRLKSPGPLNGQQLASQSAAAWQFWTGKGNPKVDWRAQSMAQYQAVFGNEEVTLPDDLKSWEDILWNYKSKTSNAAFQAKIIHYQDRMRSQVFKNGNFTKYGHHPAITQAMKKTGQPVHLIGELTFDENFAPYSSGDDYLTASLSAIFTKYKVKQFLWAHSQWDKGGIQKPKEELYKEFEEKNLKPWK
ncbi:MAG: hypothetical protein AAFY34_13605, partial [Pseudomonadota bacterium]